MKIRLIKHTGQFRNVQAKEPQADGTEKTVTKKEEILETVRETAVTAETKDDVLASERLMAESLSQDIGMQHSVELVE